ncbi:TonB-dependent receptor [Pacificimonas sp. ICDLI1SI03]
MRFRASLLLFASIMAAPVIAQDAPAPADSDPFAAVPDQMQAAGTPNDASLVILNRDLLEVLYLTEPTEIVSHAPNAVAVTTPGFGSGNFYTVRGLRDVGTYVDGVRLTRQEANHLGLFQIQQATVATGPRPMLGAQQSANGSVEFALRRPGRETHGWFEGYYGEFDRLALRGAIDAVTANEVFGLTVEGYYQDTDGYVDNLTTGDRLNQEDRHGGRLAMRLSPAANIEWNLAAAFLHDESLNILNFDCDQRCDDRYATTGLGVSQPDQGAAFADLGFAGDRARRGLGNDLDTFLVTSDFLWTGNGIELRLLTGFVDQSQESAIDYADGRSAVRSGGALPAERGLATGGLVRVADEDLTEFSQDVALGFDLASGVKLTIGAAAFERDEDGDVGNFFVDAGGAAPQILGLTDAPFDTKVKGRSLRAGVSYGTGTPLELTAGLRYSDEDISGTGFRDFGADEWSGLVSARYALSNAAAIFASASRGVSSLDAGAFGANPRGPETNWTYEGGVEAGLFGGALAARLKGFYLDAQNVRALPGFGGFDIANPVRDMTNYGAEASMRAAPFRGLNLSGAVGWQNADFEDGNDVQPVGMDPLYAPDLTANGQISYDWYIARAESFVTPSIGFEYRDDMAVAAGPVFDTGGGTTADGRVLMNAGISLRTDDDWWIVSIECDNCLDETYVDTAAAGFAYLGKPMTWMFRARRKF